MPVEELVLFEGVEEFELLEELVEPVELEVFGAVAVLGCVLDVLVFEDVDEDDAVFVELVGVVFSLTPNTELDLGGLNKTGTIRSPATIKVKIFVFRFIQ